MCNFYPRSPCGERLAGLWIWRFVVSISIHALLAESDIIKSDFSDFLILFLSTLSLRRATIGTATALKTSRDFYPRSPCGERLHNGRVNLFGFQNFYPRSPCGERLRQNFECFKWIKFLSTLSLRRATAIYPSSTPPKEYFYPRSPCGERLREPTAFRTPHQRFLSTLSLRRATKCNPTKHTNLTFLSTLSLRRATA